jgi:hypothetical protein
MSDYATNMSKSIVHTTKRLTQMIDEVRQKQEQAERDEIIRMAREACDPDKVDAWKNGFWTLTQEELERFATLVAEAEREACAWVCINEANVCELSSLISDQDKVSCLRSTAFRLSVCAAAIRARQSNG